MIVKSDVDMLEYGTWDDWDEHCTRQMRGG